MTDVHKIIAVYGNSGSFKTVTSVNLAKAIVKADSKAKVAVIGIDHTKPLIPLLSAEASTEISLGRILSCEKINETAIYKQTHLHNGIAYVGYNSDENLLTYAFPTGEKFDEFLMQMRHIFNYTIIDCSCDVSYRMTSKSLIGADEVLYLISCDNDGLAFYKSQEPILISEQYGYNSYIRCLTVTGKFAHDVTTMENAISRVDAVIPYCEKVPQMWNEDRALEAVPKSDYSKMLDAIADDLMKGGAK
ncbi:MAG: AAA family ATPase [Oscillospiraceae bacterium]|nr:AAA family ATPase [Oscillospiraceae bacterium]